MVSKHLTLFYLENAWWGPKSPLTPTATHHCVCLCVCLWLISEQIRRDIGGKKGKNNNNNNKMNEEKLEINRITAVFFLIYKDIVVQWNFVRPTRTFFSERHAERERADLQGRNICHTEEKTNWSPYKMDFRGSHRHAISFTHIFFPPHTFIPIKKKRKQYTIYIYNVCVYEDTIDGTLAYLGLK